MDCVHCSRLEHTVKDLYVMALAGLRIRIRDPDPWQFILDSYFLMRESELCTFWLLGKVVSPQMVGIVLEFTMYHLKR